MKRGILKVLMKEMADLTLPECQTACRKPMSCCDEMYCEITIHYAKRAYNITLQPTGHPTLPLMGPAGCVAEPHLRPLCTLHTCAVQSIGHKLERTAEADQWNEDYFKLRYRIEDLSYELEQSQR